MNAIHEKEYQLVQANNLCKEKARLTTECENEFNRVNVRSIPIKVIKKNLTRHLFKTIR